MSNKPKTLPKLDKETQEFINTEMKRSYDEMELPSPATGRVKVDTNITVEDRTEEAPVHDPYAREPKVTTRKVGNVTIEDRT